jgi:hypothetical protein
LKPQKHRVAQYRRSRDDLGGIGGTHGALLE